MLECLFRGITKEKLRFEQGQRTKKNVATTNLVTCAKALRTTIEVGVRTIRHKSVKALVDHITQILPSSDGSYFTLLVLDYAKTLKTVLRYQPHSEHFPKEEWHILVDFCNEIVQCNKFPVDDSSSRSLAILNSSDPSKGPLSRSATPSTLPSFRSQVLKYQTDSFKDTSGNEPTAEEEFVLCLHYLYLATNAPVLDRAQATIAVLMGLLRSPSTPQGGKQTAFATLNAILARIMTEDIELTRHAIREAIPLIRQTWSTNSATLREEMLITMVYGQSLLPDLVKTDDLEDYRCDLQGLLDVLQTEYYKRTDRLQLQIADLHLVSYSYDEEAGVPLKNRAFSLRSGALKSEQAWAVIETIASISLVLHEQTFHLLDAKELDIPDKRQKVATPIDNLLESLVLSTSPERLMSLQVLAFIIERMMIDADSMQKILEALIPYIPSAPDFLANWAMVAASWYGIVNEKLV